MPILLIIPFFSTMLGGLLAVHFRRFTVVLIAFGTGLLLGAAFLDLLPEALSLAGATGRSIVTVFSATLASFFFFWGVQGCLNGLASRWQSSSRTLGRVGGSMLIFHSFRDGMAIGLSYAASHPAGYAVAVGIAAHDIGDGMNTVLLTTRGDRPQMVDYLFLLADCIAPLAGGFLTLWWTFSLRSSVLLLAVAAGFFIQMATMEFLPEIRRSPWPRRYTLLAVIGGAAFIYLANTLIDRLH